MNRSSLALSCLVLLAGCFNPGAEAEDGDTNVVDTSAGTGTVDSDAGPSTGGGSTTTSSTTHGTSSGPGGSTSEGNDSTGDLSAPETSCPGTWHTWFRSTFEYPDDGVVGTSDFPSLPWGTVVGAPTVRDNRLVSIGESTVISSHGGPLPVDGLRLRFKTSFAAGGNTIRIGLNGDATGSGGIAVSIRASDGEFAIHDGADVARSAVVGALQLDTDYFAELEIEGSNAILWLSTGNYATIPGAEIVGAVEGGAVDGAAAGRWVVTRHAATSDASPAVDEIEVGRCDSEAPEHELVFSDSFNRPNSSTVGSADFPVNSVWNEHNATEHADIWNNRLRMSNGFTHGIRCKASKAIGGNQARLRATVVFNGTNSWPSAIWGVSGVPMSGEARLGFYLWNNNDLRTVTLVGAPGSEVGFPGAFQVNTNYYVEIAVDGNFGVATVRTASHSGPVVAATGGDNVLTPQPSNDDVGVMHWGGDPFAVDEMHLEQYSVP